LLSGAIDFSFANRFIFGGISSRQILNIRPGRVRLRWRVKTCGDSWILECVRCWMNNEVAISPRQPVGKGMAENWPVSPIGDGRPIETLMQQRIRGADHTRHQFQCKQVVYRQLPDLICRQGAAGGGAWRLARFGHLRVISTLLAAPGHAR
jgi:hypothetical protein